MFKYFSLFVVVAGLLIVQAQTQPKPAAKKTPAAKTSTQKKPATAKKTASTKPTSGKISYTINGKLVGYKNHLILLNKFKQSGMSIVDSLRTNDTGAFTFKGTATENSIFYVQYSSSNAVPLIIENGSKFNLLIHTNLNGLNYELTGTKAEKSIGLYDFIKKFSRLNGEMNNIENQINNEADPMKNYQLQMYAAMKQEELRMVIDSMVQYKSPLESYFVVFNFMEEQKPADLKSIYTRMEPNDVKSSYYTDLKTIYNNTKGIEIGELAPDIDLPQPDGKNLKLSSLRGKVVLIDFWASWCGPCRAEFPNVKRVYAKYKEKGFEIYGVSLDRDKPSWVNSISSLGLDWKHVSDLKYWSCAPAKVYKVSGIPFTVLIDKNGKVIAKNLRGAELEKKLEELFP